MMQGCGSTFGAFLFGALFIAHVWCKNENALKQKNECIDPDNFNPCAHEPLTVVDFGECGEQVPLDESVSPPALMYQHAKVSLFH